jgi:phosphoglycolate phosphatase-like HAD superfamily hydrolase
VPALIFDLDGTLVDTVYAHVSAWQRALAEVGLPIDGWRIHRRIGMSGGIFTRAVARELARPLTSTEVEAIQARHGQLFRELLPERRPLIDAVELLAELRTAGVPLGIATSGRRPEIDASLEALGLGSETVVVERGGCRAGKARTGPLPCLRRDSPSPPRSVMSSVTPSGTCSLHAGRGCSASACSAAATERTSWPAPAPFASTETRVSSGSRWTS